jgi:membrane-associated phospholipid phosphatase
MIRLIQQNKWFFGVYFVVLVALIVLQVCYSQADLSLIVNGHHSAATDVFFKWVTYLGDGLFAVLVALVLLFYAYRWAALMALCFGLSALVAQFFKHVLFDDVVRPRRFFDGQGLPLHFVEGVEVYEFNSFPSGHTATAFALFCLLSIVTRSKAWGFAYVVLACLVGYSRVYLLQHFVIDTFAGSLVGVLTTLLLVHWLQRRWRAKPRPWLDKKLWSKT